MYSIEKQNKCRDAPKWSRIYIMSKKMQKVNRKQTCPGTQILDSPRVIDRRESRRAIFLYSVDSCDFDGHTVQQCYPIHCDSNSMLSHLFYCFFCFLSQERTLPKDIRNPAISLRRRDCQVLQFKTPLLFIIIKSCSTYNYELAESSKRFGAGAHALLARSINRGGGG